MERTISSYILGIWTPVCAYFCFACTHDYFHSDIFQALIFHTSETLTKLQSQADAAEAHFNTFTSIKNKIFGAITNFGVQVSLHKAISVFNPQIYGYLWLP